MNLAPFQSLPRWLRRHVLLNWAVRLAGGEQVHQARVNGAFGAFIDLRDGFARRVVIDEEFEPEFFALARAVLAGVAKPVFFDVGANYGLMSFGLRAALGEGLQAHLFEANPHLAGIIGRSIALNGGNGFELVNGAVMDEAGECRFSFDIRHTGKGHASKTAGDQTVRALTLDGHIAERGVGRVDLMKIDVEGNEAAVLLGGGEALRGGVVRAVYFEYCPEHLSRAGHPRDPVEILRGHGFEIYHFHAKDLDRQGGATHQLGPADAPCGLAPAREPITEDLTDLIALRPGVARPI